MSLKPTVRQVAVPQSLDMVGASVFLHGENKIIARGVAKQISATGKNRVTELSEKWQQLIADAELKNLSDLPSPGIIGLTSIAFADSSSYRSTITIPETTLVIRGGVAFEITTGNSFDNSVIERPSGTFEAGSQSAQGFQESVEAALLKIKSEEIEKVVLSRDLFMKTEARPDLSLALERLAARYPGCWVYAIADVFGASPELLLRAERGEVSARVLAGTAGRGTDPDVDRAIAEGLSHSLKNKHEHRYAVQSLVAELEPFCIAVEADSEPFSLALPDLWHLATDVRGRLKPEVNLLDVIAKLHPTAAVAGTPRNEALDLIDVLEPFDRGGYAGPVGWLSSDGSGEIAIALRGGVIEPGGIRAIAGCGIVSESEAEAELAETELKFRAVRWAFS